MPALANIIELVKSLHAAYQARTGYQIAFNMVREREWHDWLRWNDYAWTETELARVIGYLRRKIGKGDRNEGALKFSNLIGRPDVFEEDLNLALEEAKKGPLPTAQRPRRAEPELKPVSSPEEVDASYWKTLTRKTDA